MSYCMLICHVHKLSEKSVAFFSYFYRFFIFNWVLTYMINILFYFNIWFTLILCRYVWIYFPRFKLPSFFCLSVVGPYQWRLFLTILRDYAWKTRWTIWRVRYWILFSCTQSKYPAYCTITPDPRFLFFNN